MSQESLGKEFHLEVGDDELEEEEEEAPKKFHLTVNETPPVTHVPDLKIVQAGIPTENPTLPLGQIAPLKGTTPTQGLVGVEEGKDDEVEDTQFVGASNTTSTAATYYSIFSQWTTGSNAMQNGYVQVSQYATHIWDKGF